MAAHNRILFLQGPPSVFWPELADAFQAAGDEVFKINFCPADSLFWRRPGAYAYRGRFSGWEAYLGDFITRHAITHILYYADQQAYHRIAGALARARGIQAIAIEFGYLRPDWLTVERNGMGVYSHFPNDAGTIRSIAARAQAPDMQVRYPYSFLAEAVAEVTFNLANVFLRPLYPFFNADKYYHPLIDYLSWGTRSWRQWRAQARTQQTLSQIESGAWPFFLLALQLQSDYQIRRNSHYQHLSQMLEEVISSFAQSAAKDARLVIKQHPLDNGMENWLAIITSLAQRHKVEDRVILIDGGSVETILPKASGCVLVNSTVGLFSIRALCPIKVLGIAVFDIAGLTHQGSLDEFWTSPEPVDPALAQDLVRAMSATIQVKGSFYDPLGRKAAQAEIVRRLQNDLINEPGAFVAPPPRLAQADALGVPLD